MIDRYKRSGIYKVEPGYVMGHEPSGQIVAVGEGMDAYKVGQKAGVRVFLLDDVFLYADGHDSSDRPIPLEVDLPNTA